MMPSVKRWLMLRARLQRLPSSLASSVLKSMIEALDIEVRVLAGDDVAHEIIAQRLDAELVGKFAGIDDVAERLAHFLAADVPPAVD